MNSEAAELGITVTALKARKWRAYQETSQQLIEQRAADALDLQNQWNARWA